MSCGRIAVSWVLAVLCFLEGSFPVSAHEFWIAPDKFKVRKSENIIAKLQVGQMMLGADFPYLQAEFLSFSVTRNRLTRNVQGIDGDSPALIFEPRQSGLHIIAYHAIPHTLMYGSMKQFEDYLRYEGLSDIAQAHRKRGLPNTGFIESYVRCAKALVQVGPVEATDSVDAIGLPFELTAEKNPYEPGLATLPVRLTWQGRPVANRQIAVFNGKDVITRTILTTDRAGRIYIPLSSGGVFLLNAVQMDAIEPETGAVWRSYWASLTFQP